jgi:hypothetical protein
VNSRRISRQACEVFRKTSRLLETYDLCADKLGHGMHDAAGEFAGADDRVLHDNFRNNICTIVVQLRMLARSSHWNIDVQKHVLLLLGCVISGPPELWIISARVLLLLTFIQHNFQH